MRDINQTGCLQLSAVKTFLDDWPAPPKTIDDFDSSNPLEVKKWRLQILLAVNPYGIPSLKFGEAFERLFGKKFDLRLFNFDDFNEMINKMPDIFAVQPPDETTAILFPDYPHDNILHDARLGHNFAKPNLDDELDSTTRLQSSGTKNDLNDLVMRAWIDRDEEFPPDVVLAGESYEQLLKISSANIPGTKGLYQATILGAASPDSIFIELKAREEELKLIDSLPSEIAKYFESTKHSIDAYNVPKEFLLPGFPCLLYAGGVNKKERTWQRCVIVRRLRGSSKVLVESIDSGGVYSVHRIFLYLIPRRFLEIPRLTLQVRLMGLKSREEDEKWSTKIGARLRCFSFKKYYIDILLIEPKVQLCGSATANKVGLSEESPCSSSGSSDRCSSQNSNRSEQAVSMSDPRNSVAYDALLIDRNDDEMDIFVDDILVLETYAKQDESRVEEVAHFKQLFKKALEIIPRPKNPFE